jgi:hypothetical protein
MRSFGDIEIVVGRPVGAVDGLPVVSIRAILATVALVTVAVVLGVTVPITIRATRAVAGIAAITVVVTVPVAVAAIVLPRRVVATTGARRPTAWRRAARSTLPFAAVEPPRSGRRGTSPLDLQHIVAADALVVHIMIRVVRIAAILVLHESKQPAAGGPRSRDVTTDQTAVAK